MDTAFTSRLFTSNHEELLLELLKYDTVSPMETGQPSLIAEAQQRYALFAAVRTGAQIVVHEPPDPALLTGEEVPLSVKERASLMEHVFWASQPNLVLRIGPPRPPAQTLVFNFHMDTVDGSFPVTYDGETFVGRGAVDMKGPGVALLAGIEAALQSKPDLLDSYSIVIQCVSGEEGGAMGVYGTKVLIDQGWYGHLNIFAEPSNGVYFDKSTTSMTARVVVEGKDATDDAPHSGHNATLLLGYIAQQLFTALSVPITEAGGKMCLAGVHTGQMHNKVYGSGQLLMNFAYLSTEAGQQFRLWIEEAFADAVRQFSETFSTIAGSALTASEAKQICRLEWVKQGLPVLNNRDVSLERFLTELGLERSPDDHLHETFTCDAMWAQREGSYTIVYGPGSLEKNLAHADGEWITREQLEEYAISIRHLLLSYVTIAQDQSVKETIA
ncbi:M20/M25/M40 family metallo-hydrolase [Paenibacillus agilis]|uniref:M20 family metallopeptidase n=1 Tax=Paenibacillus agilis TaxID=3020863 RepID=A0A559J3F2_9BACL|nr:M20/M25/M40 family metallo-hydrolase [Paenibacillus agilis]TVX94409.1 M20 family metallopeptidase [Paenibacillus agilis]